MKTPQKKTPPLTVGRLVKLLAKLPKNAPIDIYAGTYGKAIVGGDIDPVIPAFMNGGVCQINVKIQMRIKNYKY